MTAGAPRKPTAVLELQGAFKKDPQRRRKREPVVRSPIGNAPKSMTRDEVTVWKELVGLAPPGVLTKADRPALEMAVCLLAEYREDRRGFTSAKLGRLEALYGRFGMNPSARASIEVPQGPPVNEFDGI